MLATRRGRLAGQRAPNMVLGRDDLLRRPAPTSSRLPCPTGASHVRSLEFGSARFQVLAGSRRMLKPLKKERLAILIFAYPPTCSEWTTCLRTRPPRVNSPSNVVQRPEPVGDAKDAGRASGISPPRCHSYEFITDLISCEINWVLRQMRVAAGRGRL